MVFEKSQNIELLSFFFSIFTKNIKKKKHIKWESTVSLHFSSIFITASLNQCQQGTFYCYSKSSSLKLRVTQIRKVVCFGCQFGNLWNEKNNTSASVFLLKEVSISLSPIFLSQIDSRNHLHTDLCVTSCGQIHQRTLEMRRLRNTLLTTQSGGARTSTGEHFFFDLMDFSVSTCSGLV